MGAGASGLGGEDITLSKKKFPLYKTIDTQYIWYTNILQNGQHINIHYIINFFILYLKVFSCFKMT